jgi:hypothetical protein
MLTVIDHGGHVPGFVASQYGLWAHAEVHATGAQPVRVTGVGLELDNGQVVPFEGGDALPATLRRPEVLERNDELADLAKRVRAHGEGRLVKRIRIDASPDRVFRQRLPRGWERFPSQTPPARTGSPGGPWAAFGR